MHIIANRPQFGKDFEATREDYLKAMHQASSA